MTDNYDDLIVGESISELIKNKFLAKANLYTYNVGLTSLIVEPMVIIRLNHQKNYTQIMTCFQNCYLLMKKRCLNQKDFNL